MGSLVAVNGKGFENDLRKPVGYAEISWTVKSRGVCFGKMIKPIKTSLVERWETFENKMSLKNCIELAPHAKYPKLH